MKIASLAYLYLILIITKVGITHNHTNILKKRTFRILWAVL